MGVIDLSAYKPTPATLGDANQVANGFQAIQNAPQRQRRQQQLRRRQDLRPDEDHAERRRRRGRARLGLSTLAQVFLNSYNAGVGVFGQNIGEHRNTGATDHRSDAAGLLRFPSMVAGYYINASYVNGSGDGTTIGLALVSTSVIPIRIS
jgi:hypothetical protein